MYVQVRDFCVSKGPPTVPLTRISCNTVFSKSQNARKVGTFFVAPYFLELCQVLFHILNNCAKCCVAGGLAVFEFELES